MNMFTMHATQAKKPFLTILFLFLFLISSFAAKYDCLIDGIYYKLNQSDMTATVTKNEDYKVQCHSGAITIPATIIYKNKTYSVATIGDYAFAYCYSLTSVTISSSVTTIEKAAFMYCDSLTSVTIPASVTSIGDGAFAHCRSLTSITIPASVTSIGDGAFLLISNIIYSGVATGSPWGARCVNGYIDGSLMYSDASKTTLCLCFSAANGKITIPNSVTTIEDGAFAGCHSLTSVTIPNSITTIGEFAFSVCHSLTSVTIPSSVTTIGDGAFSYCSSLTSVTIPSSVTTIGDGAFYGCSSLENVYILSNIVMGDSNSPIFEECTIDHLYCSKSFDLTYAGGTIKNIHRLTNEELAMYQPFSVYARQYVEPRVNEWQQKGKYEKTTDWQARVNETTRKQKIEEFYKEAQKNYLNFYTARQQYDFTFVSYDPDNEVCLVKETELGDLLVPVAIADAPYVEQHWSSHKAVPHYAFAGSDIYVSSVDFTLPNQKTYTYKSDQKLTYATADIDYNFAPIELPQVQTVTSGGGTVVQQQGITALEISTPFDLNAMSSVLASYKNLFGKYEMPEKDITFPYVLIRVTLTGSPQLVRMAKQSLSLDLGQSYMTEQTVPQDDKILFLVPTGVKNIYLTDGNVLRKLIYSGQLIPNKIYDGVVNVK